MIGRRHFLTGVIVALVALVYLLWHAPALALSASQAARIAVGDGDDRVAALGQAVANPDEALAPFLRAMLDDEVKVAGDRVFVLRDGKATDLGTKALTELPADVEDVVINNRLRRELESALAALDLLSDDRSLREKAITRLRDEVSEDKAALIERALARESEPALKSQLNMMLSRALVTSSDPDKRLRAAQALAGSHQPATRSLLLERIAVETEPAVKMQLEASLRAVASGLAWGERVAVLFTGLSLGSILLLAALGLAITYGLMGVINMAHGELMMIGAYATYVVQNVVRSLAPAWFDAYILLAIPVSFIVAALVGAAMERSVIRWLYGRPLETLLATWGISLILMQGVRSIFGAQNVPVENPAWLSGGVELFGNLTLPYNRLGLIVFVAAVLVAVYLVVQRTRMGLFVRGVTQNRRMASCVGINTARVDTYAFALGSGLAGLAGCALSQVGNVGPDLGQSYIVDSFMVVVLGGVGQLAGTVVAALGLGVLNKLLEGYAGAVLAKIAVLVFIVMFIQKRPQGLFALKGRSAEA